MLFELKRQERVVENMKQWACVIGLKAVCLVEHNNWKMEVWEE